MSKLSFEDNYFDYALCVAALHCVDTAKNRALVLHELFRVLKPQAKAFITVWSSTHPKIKNKDKKEQYIAWRKGRKEYFRYYYLYDKTELEKAVKKAGFEVLSSKANYNIVLELKKPACSVLSR